MKDFSFFTRTVSRVMLWLNVFVLALLVIWGVQSLFVSSCVFPLERLSSLGNFVRRLFESPTAFPFDRVITVFWVMLAGFLVGFLCAWARTGLTRLLSLFLFLSLFFIFGALFSEERTSSFCAIGINTSCLTCWLFTVCAKWRNGFGWKALILGIGYAFALLMFAYIAMQGGVYGEEVSVLCGGFYSANIAAMFLVNSTETPTSTDAADATEPQEKQTPPQSMPQPQPQTPPQILPRILCFLGKLFLAVIIAAFAALFFLVLSMYLEGAIVQYTPKQVAWRDFDRIWKISFPSTVQWENFQRDAARDSVTFHGRFLVPEEEMEKLFPPEKFPRESWTPPAETEPLKVIQSLFPHTPEIDTAMRDSLEETFPWIASRTPCPNEVYLVHRRDSLDPDTDSLDTDSLDTLDMVIENTTRDKHLYTVYIYFYYKTENKPPHHGTIPPED